MEVKITKDFQLFNGIMTEDYQDNIQEFVNSFAEKFKVNWRRDIVVKLTVKHNDDGMNLIIDFKSREVTDENPNQLKLFPVNGEDSAEQKKTKVREVPASIVNEDN